MRTTLSKNFFGGTLLAVFALSGGKNAAASVTLPPLQSGWWVSTSTTHTVAVGQPATPDDPPDVTYRCENAESWAQGMKALQTATPGCTTDIEGSNGQYTMMMSCSSVGGQPGTMAGTTSITYAGQTGLHMVGDLKSDVASIKMDETDHTVVDSKFLGDCPAGVAPGDYGRMQNGAFVKIFNSLSK